MKLTLTRQQAISLIAELAVKGYGGEISTSITTYNGTTESWTLDIRASSVAKE